MDGVVSPLLQIPPQFDESTTLPPAQKVVAPPAVMTDGDGCISEFTILLCKAMAPSRVSPLPKSEAPSYKLMAPLATIVPLKTELTPKLTAPFICQYTLHKEAELISKT